MQVMLQLQHFLLSLSRFGPELLNLIDLRCLSIEQFGLKNKIVILQLAIQRDGISIRLLHGLASLLLGDQSSLKISDFVAKLPAQHRLLSRDILFGNRD